MMDAITWFAWSVSTSTAGSVAKMQLLTSTFKQEYVLSSKKNKPRPLEAVSSNLQRRDLSSYYD